MEKYCAVNGVLLRVLFLNLLVASLKFVFGSMAGSLSMVADSFHSFFDSASNVIGLISLKVASKPPDRDHPYGHGKYENLATVAIACLIFLACFEIVESGFRRLLSADYSVLDIRQSTVVVMLFTIAVNYLVSRYEKNKSVELCSPFLAADAMHTTSDIYASLSVLLGFAAVNAGYPVFDPLMAFAIGILIARMGYNIIRQNSYVLCDASILDEAGVREVVKKIPGVEDCHKVRTRGGKDNIYLDLHIWVDPKLHIDKAHEISHRVERELKGRFTGIRDVVVHVEPDGRNVK